MAVDQFLYTTAVFILVSLPMGSFLFSIVALIIPISKTALDRTGYQKNLVKFLFLALVLHVGGKLSISYVRSEEMFTVARSIATVGPAICYAVAINASGRRLVSMGLNKFIALAGVIPFVGPAFLIWLSITIYQRNSTE